MCNAHSSARVAEGTHYPSPKEKKMKGLIKAVAITFLVAVGANASADDHGMKKDIVDTAVAAGSFDTLVTAVQAAGLVETLRAKVRSRYSPPPTKRSRPSRRPILKRCWPTRTS